MKEKDSERRNSVIYERERLGKNKKQKRGISEREKLGKWYL